jgi:hypothetical protein
MRALMLLVITLGTLASLVSAAAPGDSANSPETTPSPTAAENAVAREQASAAETAAARTPATDAPAKEPASSSQPTNPTTAAAKKETDEEFKIPPSYRARLRGDETVYCRKEGEAGTRFKKTECYTLAELKYKVESEKAAADDITRRARVCSTASVCSSN